MAILLSKQGSSGGLFVVGVGCQHIQGPFSWHQASIMVTCSASMHSRATHCIRDDGAGFALTCSDVVLVRTVAGETPSSFDDLVLD
jgi:hypothetical protein